MQLAKHCLDIGLFTNQRDAQLSFWQEAVGLEFDHLAKLGGGVHQLRHRANGSIVKVNHVRDPLPSAPAAGWRELLIARDGLTAPRQLRDPDGNAVSLVPPGHAGISGIGIRLGVRDLAAALRFYRDALELAPLDETRLACGDTVLLLEADPGASADPPYQAVGYRYVTVQIFDCDAVYAAVLAHGGRAGRAPRTIGTTTRYAFVRDPDGNWIEVSERGELTGGLRDRG